MTTDRQENRWSVGRKSGVGFSVFMNLSSHISDLGIFYKEAE